MKIELKNVTYNSRLSEETAAFAATIYVDGKKRGEARNDGHGGPNMIRPHTLAEEIQAYAKTLPRVPFGFAEGDFQPDADFVISEVLNDHLMRRDFKRALGRKVMFLRDGKLYEMKKGGVPKAPAQVLNALPFEEAFSIYSEVMKKAS